MEEINRFSPLWGDWVPVKKLGKGSFGSVYQFEKENSGGAYTSAVKYFSVPSHDVPSYGRPPAGILNDPKALGEFYDSIRDRILREINICYSLKANTNIVSYEDHCILRKRGEPGYDIFFRMEYLTPLTAYLQTHPLQERDIIRLGMDICSALEVLEEHSLLHRDVKPENIFVTQRGVFKLGDFGEAKYYSDVPTDMDMHGTYTYMPPEFIKRRKADVRSDLYSLGIVLYRLLNGNRAPFVPADLQQVDATEQDAANNRRFRGEAIPLPQFCQNTELISIVMKACEFKPENRWQHPRAMRRALEALLDAVQDSPYPVQCDSAAGEASPDRETSQPSFLPPESAAAPEAEEEAAAPEDLTANETDAPPDVPQETPETCLPGWKFHQREKSERMKKWESALCWGVFAGVSVLGVLFVLLLLFKF